MHHIRILINNINRQYDVMWWVHLLSPARHEEFSCDVCVLKLVTSNFDLTGRRPQSSIFYADNMFIDIIITRWENKLDIQLFYCRVLQIHLLHLSSKRFMRFWNRWSICSQTSHLVIQALLYVYSLINYTCRRRDNALIHFYVEN